MSAGGEIIIRDSLATAAGTDDVLNAISQAKRDRLRGLLSRSTDTWTATECHFVTRCIAEAIDGWDE